ncbi:MAG: hypothetical protein GSR86_02630 [Desulfurococcales archaeon]|nr:hypothetical protein [Desulfurococcales archaeon]
MRLLSEPSYRGPIPADSRILRTWGRSLPLLGTAIRRLSPPRPRLGCLYLVNAHSPAPIPGVSW